LHCQGGWQSLLFFICVNDSINVLGALQNAHLGSKPNLDVLGVTILMLWFMSHYCSYINCLIFISITWWVYLWLHFLLPYIGCSICGYLFPHSREFFFKRCISFELLGLFQRLNEWDKGSVQWMILVYHKFVVDVFNLQYLKTKVALGQVTTFSFFLVLLSFKLTVCLQFHAIWSWTDKLISNWFSIDGFQLNQSRK
jgi:hypothetical protein